MQKSLIITLFVLATLIVIEAKPWFDKGFNGSGGRFGGGYGVNEYGRGGYGSSRYGGDGGQFPYPNNRDGGVYPHARQGCINCVIRGFGDGEDNTNTFNLPKEAYI